LRGDPTYSGWEGCEYSPVRCLYSRFECYPNSVTKVLQTLLRYLNTREAAKAGKSRKYLARMDLNKVAPVFRVPTAMAEGVGRLRVTQMVTTPKT